MKQMGNKQSNVKKPPAPAARSIQPAQKAQPVRTGQTVSTLPTAPLPGGSVAGSSLSRLASLRLGERILLPLRLFLGVTFIYAGIQKFGDPQFFNPAAIGYIGRQIIAFASGSPIHGLLMQFVLPHAKLFGVMIATGEIAIGLGALFGFLLRPAAFFGFLLSLMFFLSASWHVYPYFYGSDIVFVFAWITLLLAGPLRSGLPTLDGLIVPRVLEVFSPETQTWARRLTGFFLGVGPASAPGMAQAAPQMEQPGMVVAGNAQRMGQQPQRSQQMSYRARIDAQRRALDNRRNFLLGLVVGGLGMLGITLAARVLSAGSLFSADSGPGTRTISNANSGGATTAGTPGSSSTIAQVSAVPTNSAVNFTISSNGDPGVLVHLSNGRFVCFDATCTHAGCPVQFDPGSSLLICPCHGAEFDPANNASVVQGPTQTPLTSVPINVDTTTGAITQQ
jgi:thiosulfate dehydrogenase (quinone) large subunit